VSDNHKPAQMQVRFNRVDELRIAPNGRANGIRSTFYCYIPDPQNGNYVGTIWVEAPDEATASELMKAIANEFASPIIRRLPS
jgi:hypothetical protein